MYFTSEMNEMPIHYFWVSLMLCLFQEYIYLYIHTTHCTKHLGILGRKHYRGNWEVLVSLRQIHGGTLLEKPWKHKAPVPFLIEHYWGTFLYAVPQIWGGSSGENNKHQLWLMTLCVGSTLITVMTKIAWQSLSPKCDLFWIYWEVKAFCWVFKSKVHVSSLHSSRNKRNYLPIFLEGGKAPYFHFFQRKMKLRSKPLRRTLVRPISLFTPGLKKSCQDLYG